MKPGFSINKPVTLVLMSFGLLLFTQPSISAIYKCIDNQGNYSYSNLPCKNNSKSTRLTIDKPKTIQKSGNNTHTKPNIRLRADEKKKWLKDLEEYKQSESSDIRKRRVVYEKCLDQCINNNKQCSNVCSTSKRIGNSFSSCSRSCSNNFKKCTSTCSF